MRLFGKKPDADEKKKKAMDGADTLGGIQTQSIDLSKEIEEALRKKPAKAGNGA